MSKKLSFIVVSISVLLLISVFFLKGKSDNKVVAIVGDTEIAYSDLLQQMEEKYYDTELNNLINSEMIRQQFDKENLDITTSDELENLGYIELVDSSKNSLADEATQKYVTQYIQVEKLAEKLNIITDDILNDFLSSEMETNGNKIIQLKVIEGSHEEVSAIEDSLNDGEELDDIIKNLDIEYQGETVFSNYNEYDIDLSNNKENDFIHYMSSDTHDDSENMKLLYLTDIEDTSEELFNLEKNREIIMRVYFSKNYLQVRNTLLNELQKIYEIKK